MSPNPCRITRRVATPLFEDFQDIFSETIPLPREQVTPEVTPEVISMLLVINGFPEQFCSGLIRLVFPSITSYLAMSGTFLIAIGILIFKLGWDLHWWLVWLAGALMIINGIIACLKWLANLFISQEDNLQSMIPAGRSIKPLTAVAAPPHIQDRKNYRPGCNSSGRSCNRLPP